MSTIYLKFPDMQASITALEGAGYILSEYKDHLIAPHEGVNLANPDGSGEMLVNVWDCAELHESLVQYQTPQPLTPYCIRAGEELNVVFRTVVVTAAIRDTARALVVAMAGDTHNQMWSQGLSADGNEPATHYINSGLVRVELAQMLSDAGILSVGAGVDLPTAQYLLSQCDVSAEDPIAVMSRLGLIEV